MNDRELLELAAKAIEVQVTAYDWQFGCRVLDGANYKNWNPLTDDGDAFRLACDLGLRTCPVARTMSGAACSTVGSATCERLAEVVDFTLDTRAATRRAVVLAAAEIGKSQLVSNQGG